MLKRQISITLVTLLVAGTPAVAQEIDCGTKYTVRSGDSLSQISERAYGSRQHFSLIYNANSEVIGANPSLIVVGKKLDIPCLEEPFQESVASEAAIRKIQTTEQLPAPSDDELIRVLTATGWAPFQDEDQEQGGLLTEIVNVALERADGSPSYRIDFINDAGAHLQPLISDHRYDLSIGWSRPTCEDESRLADESLFRCRNLTFSDPIYEEVLGYFSASGGPKYENHWQLLLKTICRPAGYTIAPLEEVGLAMHQIDLVRANGASGCIDAVLSGDAELALVAIDAGQGRLSELGLKDEVQVHDALSYVDNLHVVIAQNHPRHDEILATFNNGLQKIKDEGTWFEIVRRHLSEFQKAQASN